MPPTTQPFILPFDVSQLTAMSAIILVFVLLVWKGIPALKEWGAKLIATFKEEIQNERNLALKLVADEREYHEKIATENSRVIERNTVAVDSMRAVVQTLVDRQNRQ